MFELWLALATLAGSADRCSFLRSALPAPGTEYLVRATADSVRVAVPSYSPESIGVPGGVAEPLPDSVWAQRFEVMGSIGPGSAPEGESVLVAPWGYDSACRLITWTRSVLWVDPGGRAVFGPGYRWTPEDGSEAYHVKGYVEPYVDRIVQASVDTEDRDAEWLSPEDYFEFRSLWTGADPGEAVRAWVREEPQRGEMNPVRGFLRIGRVDAGTRGPDPR